LYLIVTKFIVLPATCIFPLTIEHMHIPILEQLFRGAEHFDFLVPHALETDRKDQL
jgi:hypothetical protein